MPTTTDLLISEYIEGSSNNKALELYNGTGSSIDLTAGGYSLQYYFNGSATPGLTINLTGQVSAGDVFVVAHSSANAAILAVADQTNGAGWFNGDDAVVLRKGGVIIDSIGQVGFDPGSEWGSGLVSTADNTLRRLESVTTGDTDPTDAFNPSAQWSGFATDTVSDLGRYGQPAGFTISPLSADKAEGTGGEPTLFTFTVSRPDGAAEGSVGWALSGLGGEGQAQADDFAGPTSGTVTFAAGETSKVVSVAVAADSVLEQAESFDVTLSADGSPSARGVIRNDDAPEVQIADIQGAAQASPLVGQYVSTTGIVTARTSNGFWIQDATPDADVNTSDAVFVFTGSAPSTTFEIGKEVKVTATVAEFFPVSGSDAELSVTELQIGSTGAVTLTGGSGEIAPTLIGAGGRIPPSQVIDDDGLTSFDPAHDGADFWESLEGVYVKLADTQAVGPSFTNVGATFSDSEVFVVVDRGAGAGLATPSGGVIVQPDDFNPERIAVQEDSRVFNNDFTANTGDLLGDVTGVVSYDSRGNYEVLATSPFSMTDGGLDKEASTGLAAGDADHLTIASYNAENLDGLDDQARFDTIAAEIVAKLKSPDIVALQEVQDNDGAVDDGFTSADVTLDRLVAAIKAAGGPDYAYAYVTPQDGTDGGEPGGNIRQAFLYDPSRVSLGDGGVGDYDDATAASLDGGQVDLSLAVGRVDPTDPAFENSRKPLAAEFVFNGETVVVVNNHFNSKGGDDPLYGLHQPPVQSSQEQRIAQAEVVAGFVETIHAQDPDANVVVLGDLNDFGFSAPVQRLEAAGLTDLSSLLPENERYDYVFDGNSQDLDHILVSGNLLQAAGFDVLHINAEFADQTSDHDPMIARLAIAQGQTVAGGSGEDALQGGIGNDSLSGGNGADTLDGGDGKDQLIGDNGADRLVGGAAADVLAGGRGDDTLVGGEGRDLFVFGKSGGADLIVDFERGVDRLRLEDGLSIGSISHADLDGDGVLDAVIGFSGAGAGQVTVMGVGDYADWALA